MNWLDLFDDQAQGEQARFCAESREDRHGPTEGDIETVAPYIGMMPDESNTEDGSPLDFGKPHMDHAARSLTMHEFNQSFELALRIGF